MCKVLGIETTDNILKTVGHHKDVTLLWDQGVHSDREILTYRPDIIIGNKRDKL
jgi:hypothetical protein